MEHCSRARSLSQPADSPKIAKVGRKILISGGGRCNFTNLRVTPYSSREEVVVAFYSTNPKFSRSALANYPSSAFIELVRRHKIGHHEKKLGQLFCDKSARQIVALLLTECAQYNVEIRCETEVTRVQGNGPFLVDTNHG